MTGTTDETTTTDDETSPDETTTETKVTAEKSTTETPDVAAMERALKKANGEAEKARLRLKALEDRDKTEADKLAERTNEAEARATKAEQALLRLTVGAKKGLPPEVAARLQGADEDEMSRDADELLKVLKPGRPAGSADTGARGGAPKGGDMNTLIRERMRR